MRISRCVTSVLDRYELHAQVKSLASGGRVLFYEEDGNVLVYSSGPLASKSYDGRTLVVQEEDRVFKLGEVLLYTLTYAPTKNVRMGPGLKSRKEGILREGEAGTWLSRRLEDPCLKPLGFSLTALGIQSFAKRDGLKVTGSLFVATGGVEVMDPDSFDSWLLQGLGGLKFLGCGMVRV